MDIEIEKEKAAQIKTDQLEWLRRKEKRVLQGNGPIKRRTTMPQVVVQEVGSPLTSLIRGHHSISAEGRNLLVRQLGSLGGGMTRHMVILIHTPMVVEGADQKRCHLLQFRTAQTGKALCT